MSAFWLYYSKMIRYDCHIPKNKPKRIGSFAKIAYNIFGDINGNTRKVEHCSQLYGAI